MTRLCFVDTETTGLDPARHEVYEIAAIYRPENTANADEEHRWWLPVDLSKAEPTALRLGHYYERHPVSVVEKGLRPGFQDCVLYWRPGQTPTDTPAAFGFAEFAEQFARGTAGAHLVGAVPSFDEKFLERLLRRNGAAPAWHYHLIDVEALAAGCIAGMPRPDFDPKPVSPRPPWRSDDLTAALGVKVAEDARHTAVGDARWARDTYDAVMRRWSGVGAE